MQNAFNYYILTIYTFFINYIMQIACYVEKFSIEILIIK